VNGTLEYDAVKEVQRICEELLERYGNRISEEHLINIATEMISDIGSDGRIANDALAAEAYGQPINEAALHAAVEQYYRARLGKVAPTRNTNPIAAAVAAAASVVRGVAAGVEAAVGTAPPTPATPVRTSA
jgi:hypothetical protein